MKSETFNASFSLSANETTATGNKAESHYCITGQLSCTGTPALQSSGMGDTSLCCECVAGLLWVAGWCVLWTHLSTGCHCINTIADHATLWSVRLRGGIQLKSKMGMGLVFSWIGHWSDSSHCYTLAGAGMRRRGRRVRHQHLKFYLGDRSFMVNEG